MTYNSKSVFSDNKGSDTKVHTSTTGAKKTEMKAIKKFIPILITVIIFHSILLSGSTFLKFKSSTSMDSLYQKNNVEIYSIQNDPWVEQKLSAMTLEEKAGQMVFPHVYGVYMSEDSPDYQRLVHLVKNKKVGGLIFFLSDIYEQAVLTNKMQKLSEIPLLISADFERGVAMRVPSATPFPYNMAIGAADDSTLTYLMGKVISLEGRSMGVHHNYAPVADVNNNALNPIINVRAFGEDVDLVTRLSNAFFKGTQDGGMVATTKHFPGHGNTSLDSHKELPTITGTREELNKLELVPFQSNFDNKIMSVMVGHLSVPAIDTQKNLASTLSKKIVSDLLQNEMGFKGLIVTDAMNMHAVTNHYSTAEATVMAIKAGNDCILFPDDAAESVDAIIAAVKNGELSEERLNHSIRKILITKRWLGLDENKFIDVDNISKVIGRESHWELARQLARKSITLVKDESKLVPLNPSSNLNYSHIMVIDSRIAEEGEFFNNQLKSRINNFQSKKILLNSTSYDKTQAIQTAQNSDVIILSLYLKVRAYQGTIGLEKNQQELVESMLKLNKPTVVISHGNPYVLMHFPTIGTYLTNYGDPEVSESAAAEAIFGEIPITGKLSVSIPNTSFKVGFGLKREQTSLLNESTNSSVQEEKQFKLVDKLIDDAIDDGAFPGGVLLIAKDGFILHEKAFGHLSYDPNARKVNNKTIYDLASLTKVFASATASMICIDKNLFALDDAVSKYLPQFTGSEKEKITIRNLLLHNSGLPAWKKFYANCKNEIDVLNDIFSTQLEYETGAKIVYSDLGIILLGKVIEKVSEKTLDIFCKEEIFDKLGMKNTFYNPPKGLIEKIAPTESDTYWRNRLIRGEVHDETASLLGGVAGHAGLFSTASDLSKVLQMLLQKGEYQGIKLIKPETVELFTKQQSKSSSRALGWDTRSAIGSSAGDLFSIKSYGHTGFTGTSAWTDPTRNLFVILLTNRVHQTRENQKLYELRPKIHDAVIKAVE
ncbi:MAG: beta-N-acetylglucosaminidase [Ignavibacteria bacterium]|nr:beta-N-acetylglucosaminidase [Ignavibacteria bacterium]